MVDIVFFIVCDELCQQLIVGCCEKRFVTQFWVFVQYLKQELEVDGIAS
jgi:hypothetical protein